MKAEKRKPVYMTEEELGWVEHILWNFTDYMIGDDRPDHGMGILKDYRNIPDEQKWKISLLSGRLRWLYLSKWMVNKHKEAVNK